MGYMLNVRRALEIQLAAISGIPPIAWENHAFTPAQGTPWVKATIIPGESRQVSLGSTGARRYSGVLLVDLFYPVGSTVKAAETMAESISTTFKSGVTLTESSQRVHIRYTEPSAALVSDGWFHLPLVVAWYSFF